MINACEKFKVTLDNNALSYFADCYKIVDLDMHFNLTFYSRITLSPMVFVFAVLAPDSEVTLSKPRNWHYLKSPLFLRC